MNGLDYTEKKVLTQVIDSDIGIMSQVIEHSRKKELIDKATKKKEQLESVKYKLKL